MPDFDDLTYSITRWIKCNDMESLIDCANYFIEKMEKDPEFYPHEFITAAKEAVENRNLNEIIILADANTPFYIHTTNALKNEIGAARNNDALFRLLCIGYAALYSYHYHHYPNSYRLLRSATEMYQDDGGSEENGELLKTFQFLSRKRREKLYAADKRRLYRESAKWKKEEEQQKKLKTERDAQRLIAIKEMNERQHQKQLEASAKRLEELAEFNKLPLEKKLEIILADDKRLPEYYGLDYKAISDEELKAVKADVLQQVAVSFLKVKDLKWREFKKRVKALLAARECSNH